METGWILIAFSILVGMLMWHAHYELKDESRTKVIRDRLRVFFDSNTIAYLDSLESKVKAHDWKEQGF